MKHIKLAVIADDFTGGADAASFLKRKHANVVNRNPSNSS